MWCLAFVLFGMSPDLCRESVYGVYRGDVKVGRLVLDLTRRGDAYILTTDFAAVLAIEGLRRDLSFREEKTFDARPPHRLVRMTHASNLAGAPAQWRAEVDGERLLVTKDGRTAAAALPEFTLEAALGPALFVRARPADGARSADGRARLVGRGKRFVDGVLADTFVVEEEGERSEYLADGELFSGSFAGLRIVKESRGRVPEIALAICVAEATLVAPSAALVRAVYALPDMRLPASPRQKIAGRAEGQILLEVSAETLPAACAAAPAAAPAEPPEIAALAAELASGLAPPAAMEAFAAWIGANIADKNLDVTPSAAAILALRAGDCSERAELFAALCRARGTPARRVAGLLWQGDGLRAHAWCEVRLDGWREIDPASGGPVDAHCILLSRGQEPLDLLALLHRTVRVVRWTPADP